MSANGNNTPDQQSNYAREVIAGNTNQAERDPNQTYAGSMIEAMDGIEESLVQYADSLEAIQKQRNKLLADYDVGQQELDTLKTEERAATKTNREIEHKVALERLGIEHDAERFKQEHLVYAKQSGFWGMLKSGLEIIENPVSSGFKAIGKVLSGGAKQIFDGRARTKGYETARDVAKTFKEKAIALIEDNKIDTDQFPNAVADITKRLEEISKSEAALKLQADEVAFERLQKGVLMQRVLASGYEAGSELEEEFLPKYGFEGVEDWLQAFKSNTPKFSHFSDDLGGKLHSALTSFVYGGADTNDLHLILEASNFFQNSQEFKSKGVMGTSLSNAKFIQALVDYTERVIKPDIGYFRSKASIIDVARDAGMLVVDDYQSSETALSLQDKAKTRIRSVVMGALADQITGSARVNNYDMRRLFRDRHTRHGNRNLTESELRDGGILFNGPGTARKTVSMIDPEELLDFDEIVKIKYATRDEDLPKLDNPFIRICVHEYFQPQSVNSSDVASSFEGSPESPAAYRVINNAIINFMSKLGISASQEISNHQQSVLVQTFFDYFEDIGRRHTEEMSSERSSLQNAFGKATYDQRYSRYQRRLEKALQNPEEQGIFKALYDENAMSYLRAVPASEIEGIYNQLSSNENLPISNRMSGSLGALTETITGDARTANMAEPLQLGWMDNVHLKTEPDIEIVEIPLKVGDLVEGKGIYGGVWKPNKESKNLFRLYASPQSLTLTIQNDFLAKSGVSQSEGIINGIGKLRAWNGFDGKYFKDHNDIVLTALSNPEMLSKWFLPTKSMLHHLVTSTNMSSDEREFYLSSTSNELENPFYYTQSNNAQHLNNYWGSGINVTVPMRAELILEDKDTSTNDVFIEGNEDVGNTNIQLKVYGRTNYEHMPTNMRVRFSRVHNPQEDIFLNIDNRDSHLKTDTHVIPAGDYNIKIYADAPYTGKHRHAGIGVFMLPGFSQLVGHDKNITMSLKEGLTQLFHVKVETTISPQSIAPWDLKKEVYNKIEFEQYPFS